MISHSILRLQAHGVSPRFEAEAEKICKQAWLELDRHPVLKAVVLERSVFFVLLPIFRFLGDTGLRTTSVPTSRETNRPTSQQTHLYAKRLDLNLTRPSTILDALRSRGSFSPSRGNVITSISPATSGFRVQILCMNQEKPQD